MPHSPQQPQSVSGEGLTVSGVSLRYAGTYLFERLDVSFEAGAWTSLLGPSGVGKTSLLRAIAELEALEPGGTIVGEHGPVRGRIAYMAQQDLLLPWSSVLANVVLGARLRSQRPDYARARALLAQVGLSGRESALPATLSAGMRQRVALARTLMEDRPIVLMDEPFSALDAITRLRLQELAANLLRGRTVLFVTHDPLEALRLGHRIVVMAGRPAHLQDVPAPAGEPPRDPSDPVVLERQADLLHQLSVAQTA